MSENKKSWWEKIAIIATLTIALTGLTRLVWDSGKSTPPLDPTLQQYAQQNQLLQQQQLALLNRLDAMEKEQLKTNQAALESKLQALTAKLTETTNSPAPKTEPADSAASTQANPTPTPNVLPNISGVWKNIDGSATYTLAQNAQKITLREERTTQEGKITTAVGEGYIENNQLNVSFTTIFETTGSGTLNIADDKTLKGKLTNATTAATEEVVLSR